MDALTKDLQWQLSGTTLERVQWFEPLEEYHYRCVLQLDCCTIFVTYPLCCHSWSVNSSAKFEWSISVMECVYCTSIQNDQSFCKAKLNKVIQKSHGTKPNEMSFFVEST